MTITLVIIFGWLLATTIVGVLAGRNRASAWRNISSPGVRSA